MSDDASDSTSSSESYSAYESDSFYASGSASEFSSASESAANPCLRTNCGCGECIVVDGVGRCKCDTDECISYYGDTRMSVLCHPVGRRRVTPVISRLAPRIRRPVSWS